MGKFGNHMENETLLQMCIPLGRPIVVIKYRNNTRTILSYLHMVMKTAKLNIYTLYDVYFIIKI